MTDWPPTSDALFNPKPRLRTVPISDGQHCLVFDDVLLDPGALAQEVARRGFTPGAHYPYPGPILMAPPWLTELVTRHFAEHARTRLGGRRVQSGSVRFSLVSTPPEELAPIQWQCHRDRLAVEPEKVLFAASVLYLFRDPALGGTSFYRSRLSRDETEQLVADSAALGATEFTARYGVPAGYMQGSNRNFELVASVPAAWNRLICYDGSLFHSADVDPSRLSDDPLTGRLTLNGFYICTRAAR
jgi:hypothetical protein